MRKLSNIFWLGTKELWSLGHDTVLCVFLVWAFSLAVLIQAKGHLHEVYQASVGFVDEDNSPLSRRIVAAFRPPEFKTPEPMLERDIDAFMNAGRYTFVIDIPPGFQRDVEAGRRPVVQVDVDATAIVLAGLGEGYARQIISDELTHFLSRIERAPPPAVALAMRLDFNANAEPAWFMSVMAMITYIIILAMVLPAAAVVREREHGTLDHLLVMPLTPFEIALAKIWANGLVLTVAVAASVYLVVERLVGVPITGSVPLFLAGVAVYLFFSTAIGVFLGTLARSMPQLGLMTILISLPMIMLSGANTPLENIPGPLRTVMLAWPSTHFVAIAQKILYRGAGWETVWPHFAWIAGVGALFFGLALARFRRVTVLT